MVFSQDGASTTVTDRRTSTLLAATIGASAATIVEISFVSFIADGIRINVDKTDGSTNFITIVLIGGDNVVNVDVTFVALGSGTAPVNLNIGFTPTVVLVSGIDFAAETGPSTNSLLHFGVVHNDGSSDISVYCTIEIVF